MTEIREFACWDGPEKAPLVRKWVPLEDYERLRAALQKILDQYHPDGNPMYLHDIAWEALQVPQSEPQSGT